MKPACVELAELRSAFVDGALDAADYDCLSAHLAGCASCRQDVADLRTVHDLVRRRGDADLDAPAGLSVRLCSIADAAAGGSWGRSARRTGSSVRRRGLGLRASVVSVAVGATIAAAGVTGYLAAPAEQAAVTDPTGEAEVEYSSAVGQLPFSSDTMTAVAGMSPASLGRSVPSGPDPAVPTGEPVGPSAAQQVLGRAAVASGSVNYRGAQSYAAYEGPVTYTADVEVVSQSGATSQISVVSRNGRAVASDFFRTAAASRMDDTQMLTLLSASYDLSGTRGATVAGRPATLVQAARAGTVSGRWWVDDGTGLILWQQRFDVTGRLRLSTGFTSVVMGDRPDLVLHLPPRPALPATGVTLALSNAEPLRAGGWSCGPELAGLSLIRLRANRVNDPTAVQLLYSDGLDTVSVFEQHGRLAGAPPGSTWDAGVGAYLEHGTANLASWGSGDTVITVMTDGSPELLARAVGSLPHQPVHERTTMERVRAGWGRLLAL